MATWSKAELQKITKADDLHIAPFRDDGKTYGTPTWIWSASVGDALYVRGYNGTESRFGMSCRRISRSQARRALRHRRRRTGAEARGPEARSRQCLIASRRGAGDLSDDYLSGLETRDDVWLATHELARQWWGVLVGIRSGDQNDRNILIPLAGDGDT
jgi:hypothetical protein